MNKKRKVFPPLKSVLFRVLISTTTLFKAEHKSAVHQFEIGHSFNIAGN